MGEGIKKLIDESKIEGQNERQNEMIEALRDYGISEEDIQGVLKKMNEKKASSAE